jgi:hypothetical protein
MTDCESSGIKLREKRLNVANDCLAGCRISHMPYCGRAGEAIDDLAAGKCIAYETEAPFGVKTFSVKRYDAGGFLAAMLERVQSERCNRSSVRMAENAKYAALLAQTIGVGVKFDVG